MPCRINSVFGITRQTHIGKYGFQLNEENARKKEEIFSRTNCESFENVFAISNNFVFSFLEFDISMLPIHD